eukprot:SAG11_NODE_30871_length_296_cov_6.761421_1_plen_33_part_10
MVPCTRAHQVCACYVEQAKQHMCGADDAGPGRR